MLFFGAPNWSSMPDRPREIVSPRHAAATHDDFNEFVASADPVLRPICLSLRRQIVALHGDHTCIVWRKLRMASFGVGPSKMSEHYAYIAVHPAHVNLGFYRGASLSDSTGLLKGTGKKLRHISFREVGSTKKAAVTALLRQAISDRLKESAART